MKKVTDLNKAGEQSYRRWKKGLESNPEFRTIYDEEAAKSELWLQLVEARQAAGLTQAEVAKRIGITQGQVARLEKRGYDGYTLTSLRRYVEALGGDFKLEVRVQRRGEEEAANRFSRVMVSR